MESSDAESSLEALKGVCAIDPDSVKPGNFDFTPHVEERTANQQEKKFVSFAGAFFVVRAWLFYGRGVFGSIEGCTLQRTHYRRLSTLLDINSYKQFFPQVFGLPAESSLES